MALLKKSVLACLMYMLIVCGFAESSTAITLQFRGTEGRILNHLALSSFQYLGTWRNQGNRQHDRIWIWWWWFPHCFYVSQDALSYRQCLPIFNACFSASSFLVQHQEEWVLFPLSKGGDIKPCFCCTVPQNCYGHWCHKHCLSHWYISPWNSQPYRIGNSSSVQSYRYVEWIQLETFFKKAL